MRVCIVLQGGTGSGSFFSKTLLYPVNIIYHFLERGKKKKKKHVQRQKKQTVSYAELPQLHVFKCWVCACACQCDRGRKGFVHA